MCYCPTPTLHLNLALTVDGAFLFSLKKTHSVWFISVLNYGDTENVLINHLLLVITMSYPCHYTNLCPHKPHKHAHTTHPPHTHTHTHHTQTPHTHHNTHTHTHTHRHHTHTHKHTHTYTHTHTHTHTQRETETHLLCQPKGWSGTFEDAHNHSPWRKRLRKGFEVNNAFLIKLIIRVNVIPRLQNWHYNVKCYFYTLIW